ncbi:MAG TPA: hypothetical protein PKJ19_05735 [Flavobacteriales bacterium]|nr:hypothetical protein [Flavobacteriales bacterium]HNU57533.1 hypothetical protein [Flavobacteriales bacterium]
MGLHHIRLDRANPEARLSGATMPRIEFRQALFRTPRPGWQRRLYTASLVVTTTALGVDDRRLAVHHQSFRFSLLYNASWPEPVFLDIRSWPYQPLELKENAPVVSWTVEMRLRDLRLAEDEWVELAFLG